MCTHTNMIGTYMQIEKETRMCLQHIYTISACVFVYKKDIDTHKDTFIYTYIRIHTCIYVYILFKCIIKNRQIKRNIKVGNKI